MSKPNKTSKLPTYILVFWFLLYILLFLAFVFIKDKMWEELWRNRGLLLREALYNYVRLYCINSTPRQGLELNLSNILDQVRRCFKNQNYEDSWKAKDKMLQFVREGGYALIKKLSSTNLLLIDEQSASQALAKLITSSLKRRKKKHQGRFWRLGSHLFNVARKQSRVWNCWHELDISSRNSLRFNYNASQFFLTFSTEAFTAASQSKYSSLAGSFNFYQKLWSLVMSIILVTIVPGLFSYYNMKTMYSKPLSFSIGMHIFQYCLTFLLIGASIFASSKYMKDFNDLDLFWWMVNFGISEFFSVFGLNFALTCMLEVQNYKMPSCLLCLRRMMCIPNRNQYMSTISIDTETKI